MGFATAADIVNDSAKELGLISASVTDPFGSNDPNILQMCSILKGTGQRLVRYRDWVSIQQEHSFVTVAATDTYALPAGFRKMVDQTFWVRSIRTPMGGPLNAQEWQYLSAQGSNSTYTVLFRQRSGEIQLFPSGTSTPGSLLIYFEYASDYWVQTAAGGLTVPDSETPGAAGDTCWFDSYLLVRALKRDFMFSKGMGTPDLESDFRQALHLAIKDDSPARPISLNRNGGVPLLSSLNIPETDYGA